MLLTFPGVSKHILKGPNNKYLDIKYLEYITIFVATTPLWNREKPTIDNPLKKGMSVFP